MSLLDRMSHAEIPVCLLFNRMNRRRLISRSFAIVSRLGDGVFWYSIILALPFLYGSGALTASLHMILVGLVSLAVYKALKSGTSRQRPFRLNDDILQNVRALDEYSFPSGHTMHAVGFTAVLLHYYPEWWPLVVPFTALVAVSRLILGLHYPSDVLVGAGIGAGIALLSLQF